LVKYHTKIKSENVEISVISGEFSGTRFYEAPKNSWASDPDHSVNIFLVKICKGGKFNYPAKQGVNRSVYFFEGHGARLCGESIHGKEALFLNPEMNVEIESSESCEFLFLEAKPIAEPVIQYGPFVMNTREEIERTFRDYERTQFGGWKWNRHDMIHGPGTERFAKYPDGRIDKPKG
jgi:quercetin 2,3-dioxygenase